MPESLLRDLQCRVAKPRASAYRLNDGGGLCLLIKSTGLKYWQFRYTKPDSREGLIQIGPYPRVTLEQARAARNEHRAAVALPTKSTQTRFAKFDAAGFAVDKRRVVIESISGSVSAKN